MILEKLRIELEVQYGEALSNEELAYLKQIKTTADLKNYGQLKDLAFDAAIAMGLPEEEAEAIISTSDTPQKVQNAEIQLADAQRALDTFKYKNQSFVAQYKAMKKEERESQTDEMFEKFWNN